MAINIDIRQTDIDYAKTFITQYLENQFPSADFSDGTALQDLVVRSISYTFAFLRSELEKVKTLRSLTRLQQLDDDEEIQEAVDDIISNFFINRGTGSNALVGVTITLSQKVDVFLGTTITFNRDGTHVFRPTQDYSIDKETLIEQVNSAGTTTYQFDATLIADAIGEDYEVEPGNFISWDTFNPYVLTVRNNQKATGGSAIENNDTYIGRSNEAITVRNLINPRSIRTVLLDLFKDIGLKDVTTIGYGDPEMLRDTINTNVTWTTIDLVHIGNHQDIYVNLPLTEDQTLTAVTYTEQYIGEPDRPGAIALPPIPIYKIHSVRDSLTQVNLPYYLHIRDHKTFFTKEQEAYVVLVSGENGKDVTIVYDTVAGFDLIHNYLRDPDERVTLANSLARAVIPIYIEVNVPYRQVTGQPTLDIVEATQSIIDFVNEQDNSTELNVDSLLRRLHSLYGSRIIIQNPLSLKGTVYYPNGTRKVFYSENILTVPEFEILGVTNRVCGYYTSSRYITFTQVG